MPKNTKIIDLQKEIEKTRAVEKQRGREGSRIFQPLTGTDLLKIADNTPVRKRIWGDYVFEGMHTAFIGEQGTLKSFLGANLALAVANHETEFLRFPIEKSGKVLYIDTELGEEMTAERIGSLLKQLEHPGNFQYHTKIVGGSPSIKDEFFQKALQYIQEQDIVLVLLDNIKAGFGGLDFMKEEAVSPIMGALRDVCRVTGTALITFIHTRKHTSALTSSMDLLSGSGQIANLLDKGVTMRKSRQPDKYMFSMQKGRNTPEGDTGFFYWLDPDIMKIVRGDTFLKSEEYKHLPRTFGRSEGAIDEKYIVTKVLTERGYSITDITKILGVSERTVSRLRKKIRE
jgi:hypothetical protein